MTETNIDILGGHSQVNPAATQAYQYNYYGQAAPAVEPAAAPTVVVLGAGVDVAAGLPAPGSLIPRITDWLETNTGKAVDTALRKLLKGLRFRFDKFVDNTITRLSQDLDRERDAICSRVRQELEQNDRLDDGQRRMGQLIVRIFQKITDVKDGATIDEETETLIREVTGIELTEETIIDFARINYTKTFEAIIRHILQTSLHDTDHPILRHVYTHLLDIGQLLAQYFYGFFSEKPGAIKTYLYIAWTLWAYLVYEEQAITALAAGETLPAIYRPLCGKEQVQVITFNHTSFAATASPTAIYFNGNLVDYVDIENKNDLHLDELPTLDLPDFFQRLLSEELSLEGERIAIPIPSFMPPLKLKPVLSGSYIHTWYRSAEALSRAGRILILGHVLHTGDAFFNDMLRANRRADIILIAPDLEAACHSVCITFQQPAHRYTTLMVQGFPARKYDNRITVIGADLARIDWEEWLE